MKIHIILFENLHYSNIMILKSIKFSNKHNEKK